VFIYILELLHVLTTRDRQAKARTSCVHLVMQNVHLVPLYLVGPYLVQNPLHVYVKKCSIMY
jgi:hypothetical protein